MLIYKISLLMFKDHYVAGVRSFKSLYLEYQADYFCNYPFSKKELLVAGNTYLAFNDYWQIIVENGVVSAVVLIAVILLIVYLIRRCAYKYTVDTPLLLLLSITILFTFLIAACFTYILPVLFFRCCIFSCLILITYYALCTKKGRKVIASVFLIGNMLLILNEKRTEIFSSSTFERWRDAQDLWFAGYTTESVRLLDSIYLKMRTEQKFLGFYADKLLITDRPEDAERIFLEVIKIMPSNSFYQKLGDCYNRQHKYKLAEKAYKRAVFMVPNRFSTRFSLLNFYIKRGQRSKALSTGQEILNLPVKVPSKQVEYIKSQVQLELKKL
jgi:tetratricopeptide (TPR) repeat protein